MNFRNEYRLAMDQMKASEDTIMEVQKMKLRKEGSNSVPAKPREAHQMEAKRTPKWLKYGSAAAIICLIALTLSVMLHKPGGDNGAALASTVESAVEETNSRTNEIAASSVEPAEIAQSSSEPIVKSSEDEEYITELGELSLVSWGTTLNDAKKQLPDAHVNGDTLSMGINFMGIPTMITLEFSSMPNQEEPILIVADLEPVYADGYDKLQKEFHRIFGPITTTGLTSNGEAYDLDEGNWYWHSTSTVADSIAGMYIGDPYEGNEWAQYQASVTYPVTIQRHEARKRFDIDAGNYINMMSSFVSVTDMNMEWLTNDSVMITWEYSGMSNPQEWQISYCVKTSGGKTTENKIVSTDTCSVIISDLLPGVCYDVNIISADSLYLCGNLNLVIPSTPIEFFVSYGCKDAELTLYDTSDPDQATTSFTTQQHISFAVDVEWEATEADKCLTTTYILWDDDDVPYYIYEGERTYPGSWTTVRSTVDLPDLIPTPGEYRLAVYYDGKHLAAARFPVTAS